MEIEPNTKLREWQVKERWGIDKLKLAEYVWEKGLPAFDQYGRRIPTVEMVVVLNSPDMRNDPEKQKDFFSDQITYFISDDVLNFEYDHGIKPTPAKESTPITQTKPQADNYFKQNGNHWEIRFGIEFAAHVDHVDGLLYIAHILNNIDNVISDQKLYNLAKGATLNEDKDKMTVSMAIANDLHFDTPPQKINDPKAQNEYINKYKQLQHDLDDAESNLEKNEIEYEMEKLLPFLTRRNIPNPEDKKAQVNITRLLDRAYARIKKANMPNLAKHLSDKIKPDNYGRKYSGTFIWQIEIGK